MYPSSGSIPRRSKLYIACSDVVPLKGLDRAALPEARPQKVRWILCWPVGASRRFETQRRDVSQTGVYPHSISPAARNAAAGDFCIVRQYLFTADAAIIIRSNSRLLGFPGERWYDMYEVMIRMETKDVILKLRTKNGLSQDALADKIYVTRQAVSRWETGETVPNVETLKLLSKLFDVSINTLLGSPRTLICQCCGMPLDDASISREPDGTFNEGFCKWCYADGKFVYTSLEELTDFLVAHMSNESWPPDQARAYFEAQLPELNHWKQPGK